MNATVEIPQSLAQDIRRLAERRGMSVEQVIEQSLRQLLDAEARPTTPFRLRDASFRGQGLQEGVRQG